MIGTRVWTRPSMGIALGLLLGGCGAGVVSRARTVAPHAVEAHLADAQALDTSELVEVPPAAAWNAAVEGVRGEVPISAASFDQRRIETHWRYEEPSVAHSVATQRRVRHRIQLAGGQAGSFRLTARAEAQIRRRETCQDPTDWSQAPADVDDELVGAGERALERVQTIDLESLAFPGTPESLLPEVRDLLIERWGLAPAPGGLTFPLRSGWRETTSEGDNVSVTVRSSVTIRAQSRQASATGSSPGQQTGAARAAAPSGELDSAGSSPDHQPSSTVHFDVDGVLEWQGEHDEEATAWMAVDASAAVADFYARLAERIPPQRVIREDVAPLEPSDPEPSVPELPNPPDPLSGSYALYVRVVAAPPERPGGGDWDRGAPVVGVLVRLAPHIYRLVRVAFTGDITALRPYLQYLDGGEPEADRIAREWGQRVSDMRAPDMYLAIGLASGGFGMELPNDSFYATGTEPLRITIAGDGALAFNLSDRDVDGTETIAEGSFSLSELANACRPVCQHVAGAAICLELQRVR